MSKQRSCFVRFQQPLTAAPTNSRTTYNSAISSAPSGLHAQLFLCPCVTLFSSDTAVRSICSILLYWIAPTPACYCQRLHLPTVKSESCLLVIIRPLRLSGDWLWLRQLGSKTACCCNKSILRSLAATLSFAEQPALNNFEQHLELGIYLSRFEWHLKLKTLNITISRLYWIRNSLVHDCSPNSMFLYT